MGPRLHRAAQQERAVQEGRRPAQRPRPDPAHLLQARLRLDRPGRPARPLPVDGPLHPARSRLRRRQDRHAVGGGARRRVLHAPCPLRRPAAHRRRRPGAGHHRRRLRPRHRRRHRPGEHPVPLDPDRGRARDLGAPRRRRPQQRRGVRRLAPPVPRLPGRRGRQGRDHRRHVRAGGDLRALHRRPGVLQPAAQVQDRAHRAPRPRRLPRDQRRRLRRHRPPRARPGLRPVGRWRAVDQPDARGEARRLDPARRGGRRLGRGRLGLPRLRLPPAAVAGPSEVPGRRLGGREVPRGPREGVPRACAGLLPLPRVAGRPPRPHRRPRAEGRQAVRRRRPHRRVACPARCWCSWPT